MELGRGRSRLLATACALFLLAPAFVPTPGRSRRRHPARAASTSDEARAWQEAFSVELERNRLLLEQLRSQGLPTPEPHTVTDDWAQNYESLAACNRLLEEQLSSAKAATADLEEQLAGPRVATFAVQLPRATADTTIELVPFFGRKSAFYSLLAGPPLGLEFEKAQSGRLQGGFVVKAVLPEGSTSGEVLPGDVLQALTVTAEGDDRSGWTDVVSSFVGGLEGGSLKQSLVDASFINTVDDLVAAVQGNAALGPAAELLLIFERDVGSSTAPARTLEPLAQGSGVVADYTDGLVSPTRSTDIG